jgi:hypothetical protein
MKKNFFAVLLITLFVLSSCINDFLDIEPQSDITQENFWKTESDLKFALNGGYSELQKTMNGNSGMSYLSWYVVRGEDFIGGNAGSRPIMLDISLNTIPSGHKTTDWNGWYKTIGVCNYALHYIPQMTSVTQAVKNKYIAEAAFLRAYCYFNLCRIWGDVPLVLTPTLVPEDAIKPFRTVQSKVMVQIVTDLDLALESSSKTSSSIVVERGNIGAIYSLYTQVCMWNHTEADYQKAIVMAQALLDLKKFNLEPVENYRKIFVTGKTQENIWTLQWLWASNGANYATYEMCKASDVSLGMSKSFRTLWDEPQYKNDQRRKQSIDTVSNVVSNYPSNYVTVKRGGTAIRKWVDSDNPRQFMTSIINETPLILLRLADIILLKAEAHNKLKQFDLSLVELNKIRSRAKIPLKILADYNPVETERMNAIENDILQERRFELMGEYCRVFDLMRTGKLKESMNNFYDNEIIPNAPTVSVTRFSGDTWYLPVYESNIIENENLLAPPIE